MRTIPRTVASCIGVVAALSTAACGVGASGATDQSASDDAGTLVAAWVSRSLPAGVALSVDDVDARDTLAQSGLTTTVGVPTTREDAAEAYRISHDVSPGIGYRALTADLTAVPVARFGTGDGSWLVDRLVAGPSRDVADEIVAESVRRTAAGAALLTNPSLDVCPNCAPVLSAGGLDLRAESLLAVLASTGQVVLTQVLADPAEARVGLPARSIVVGGASPSAVRSIAGATVGAYRPTITAVTTTTTTLTWNLTATTTLTGV